MTCFCDNYNLKTSIKQPTRYKNPDKPTQIDLLLTNAPRSFQSACVLETRLSDFDLMTLTVMRKCFKKLQPRIINYRSYNNNSNEKFKSCLLNELTKEDFANNDKGFEKFCNIIMKVLNKHAPRKKKIVRGNKIPLMTKNLSKEMMKRSRLRNRFLKDESRKQNAMYTKRELLCISFKKD